LHGIAERSPPTYTLSAGCGYGMSVARRLAAVTAGGGIHGFTATLTSFVGRAESVDEVADLLDQCRLVTVTGPGGVGKTRLACEVARLVADRFADGVWLAELAAVRDPSQVAAEVAAALGVRELPEVPPAEALARVLARRQLLVVLDNCEHVVDEAARLCVQLLPAADDVRVLATSREPLRVPGEARYRLGPLALPEPDDAPDAAERAAVVLFTDRARRADARFVPDTETRLGIARLVARLDGIPLAIELAAARVEALGVAQLLDRIDDRFGLLTVGDRVAEGRHRSLAATVQWSYQLLDEHERRVFRALSVFPGPFTLDAAEAVAGASAGPVVLRLVDCSLLIPPQAGPDGRARYVMLETLRDYGATLLEREGEDSGVAVALARYALGVAEQVAAGLQTSTGEAAAARRLDAEDATMRQVLAWAIDHDAEMALRLAVVLAPWWFLRGRTSGQFPLLLAAAGRAAPGSGRWRAMQFWLGYTALFSGDLTRALGHFTAIHDAIRDRKPSRTLADCLSGRSMTLLSLGRIAEAAADGHRSLAVAREIDHPLGEALALAVLSSAAFCAGDAGDAVLLARQAQQIPADIPGMLARRCNWILIDALTEVGDLAAAELACTAGLAQSREAGDLWAQARMLQQMAILDLRAGRVGAAAVHLRDGLQVALRTSSGLADVLDSLDCCGFLCAATNRFAEAITLWTAYTELMQREGFTDVAYARRRHKPLHEARQMLGTAQAQAAEERGAAMSIATAAEYALMLTTADPRSSAATTGLGKLSARERELVTLVARGCTDVDIAAQLHISIRTVGSHLDRIRDKTGYRRRVDLTRLAFSSGLV
jgi:non-specific serine/threonine protein kinase